MVDVRLPIDNHDDPRITAGLWNDALLNRFSNAITARTYKHQGRWYVRASAQIYTDLDDFEVFGTALNTICTATVLAAYGAYSFISDIFGAT